jgi:alanyl aminopeptidase
MRNVVRSALPVSIALAAFGCADPGRAPAESAASSPVAAAAPVVVADLPPSPDGRLSAKVHPRVYDLELTVDPRQATFEGRVRIDVTLDEPTQVVVLHGVSLTVRSASMREAGGGTLPVEVAHRRAPGSSEDDELVVQLPKIVGAGEHVLEIAYEAPFGAGLAGLYKVDEGGRSYAFTQFEAIDARRAFPCFDEPGFKVPMRLAVRAPKGMIALANMPEASRVDEGERTLFRFEPTPPTSSYLLALAVGDLDVREGVGARVPVRLVTTKGQSRLGARALEETVRVLAELERWFGTPYPYPKLDIVAVPNFRAGAMENPGLVTFRDSLLLLDEGATVASRFAQTTVIAHELAHQWFGDLVTLAWWNDIWLNEGFANWLETKITDLVRPEFEDYAHSVVEVRSVMAEDTLASTRVVRQPVRTAADAEDAFDGITYVKGGAFLDMLQGWVGEEKFREGIRRYVGKFAWKNATSEDFLATFDDGSGTVGRVAKSFLEQPGVPVITLERNCGKSPKVVVHQRADVPVGGAPVSRTWSLPLCAGTGGARACTVIETADATIEGALAQAICSGGLDAGASLYAHVDPTPDDAKPGRLAKLTGRERAAKLLDAAALVAREPKRLPLLLSLLEQADPFVDRATMSARNQILASLADAIAKPNDPAFEAYAAARLARAMAALEKGKVSDGTTLQTKSAWMTADRVTGGRLRMDDEAGLAAAYLEGRAGKLADKAAAALELSMRRGTKADVDARIAKLAVGVSPDKRPALVRSIFAASDDAVFDGSLEFAMGDAFRLQDARFLFGAASSNGRQRLRFVDWIDARFDDLTKRFPDRLAVYFVDPIGWVCDAKALSRLEASFTPRVERMPEARRTYDQAREAASRCVALREAAAPFASFAAPKR